MGNTFIICEFVFQPQPEPDEATNPPPTKRLRLDELTHVIVILPDGERHQLDISQESPLKVGNVNTLKSRFRCLSFTINIITQMYAQDRLIIL